MIDMWATWMLIAEDGDQKLPAKKIEHGEIVPALADVKTFDEEAFFEKKKRKPKPKIPPALRRWK